MNDISLKLERDANKLLAFSDKLLSVSSFKTSIIVSLFISNNFGNAVS